MGSVGTGDCTADTCPVQNGFFWVAPSLAGSVVMMAAFGVLVPINFFLGVRYKTPWYSATVIAGLVFEIMGYVGRLLQRNDLADRTSFVLFLLGTVMAPTFISAAIYAVLPHVMVIYGRNVSVRLRPAFIGSVFIAFDIFALAFQGAGSAFAAGGPSKGEISQGLNLLVGGLAIQAASLVLFFVVLYWFFRKITVNQEQLLDHTYSHIYLTSRFKIFLMSTQFATFFLLIRTIFRLVQLANGLDSVLAQSQMLTLVLDGVLVLVAALMLTILPPGVAFGPIWAVTSPYFTPASSSSRRRFFRPPNDGQGPYGFRPAVADDVFSYETPAYEAKTDRLPQRESVPAHWQHPGYKRPKVARPAPVRVPGHARGPSFDAQRNGVGGGMGTVAYEYDYNNYDGSKPAHSPSAPLTGGSGGGSASVTPTTAAPPSEGSSPLRSLPAKRMSERRDVVDPDALW